MRIVIANNKYTQILESKKPSSPHSITTPTDYTAFLGADHIHMQYAPLHHNKITGPIKEPLSGQVSVKKTRKHYFLAHNLFLKSDLIAIN
jgi:hypothetical protein